MGRGADGAAGPSGIVARLLREGNLQEARRAGEQAVAADPADEDSLRVLAEVYIALEAECLATGVTTYMPQIAARLDDILPQLADAGDLGERHERALLSAVPGYAVLSVLEQLSARDGHEREAWTQAKALRDSGGMDTRLSPVYATIMARYMRVAATADESVEARRLLADYLALPVARPSRIHSLMLRHAVRLARKHPDFNFTRFFEMWNAATLRPDDISPADGSTPLAVTAMELVIGSDDADRFPALLERMPGGTERRMSTLRHAFHNLTVKAVRDGDTTRAVDLLTLYSTHAAMHGPSRVHSNMMRLALKVMTGGEQWRFPEFMVNWDCSYFVRDDFEPTAGKDGREVPSLADRAMRRCYAAVKADVPRHAYLLPRVVAAFDTVASLSPVPPDELSSRRRAGLLSMMECDTEAFDLMASMAREGDRTPGFWSDFADIAPSGRVKAGLLALGLLSCGDKPGVNDLRLYLARQMHFDGDDRAASAELDRYREQCDRIAAEPLPAYGAIRRAVPDTVVPGGDAEMLYHELAAEALAHIYRSVPSTHLSVISRNEAAVTLSDGACTVEVEVERWRLLSRLRPGDNVELKRTRRGIVMARPVDGEPFGSLPVRYGVVTGEGMVHCAGKPDAIPCPGLPASGEAVRLRVYTDAAGTRRGMCAEPVAMVDARRHFDRLTVTVYRIDGDTAHYTPGPDGEPGVMPVGLLPRLEYGTPVDIYFYRLRDCGRVVVSVTEAMNVEECHSLKSVSGPLTRRADGTAVVRDVLIPAARIEGMEVPDSAYVRVTAMYIPRRDGEAPYWEGVSVEGY